MRNILHVVNISFVIPYYLGDQITFFKNKGVNTHIACTQDNDLFNHAKKWDFIAFPLTISRKFSPLLDLVSIIRLYRYIKLNKIDLVIGHTPKGAFIAILASYFAKVKIRVYFRHGLMFETSSGLKKMFLIFIEKLTSFFFNNSNLC